MRVAMVSFGHVDVAMPLAKYLNKDIAVDLFLVFSLNKKRESLLDFSHENISTGFLNNNKVNEILGDKITHYISGTFKTFFFIYHNLKLHSFKNLYLSFILAKSLKKYDLIHFNGINGVLPHLLILLTGKKFIFTIHDYTPHSGELKSKFPILFNRWIIKSKHEVILHNQMDYQNISEHYPKKSKKLNHVPFGKLELYKIYYNPAFSHKTNVLFFGRISKYKGIDYLIEAAGIINKIQPDIKITIAGKSNYPVHINGQNNIEFMDRYIPNDELAGLITNCDVVVCPYTDATQSAVIMTAYAFNKPVIATNVGGLPEVIENNRTGILVPPKDSKALADAIIILLTDNKKIDEMNKNIASYTGIQDLSWNSIAGKTKHIYKKALK